MRRLIDEHGPRMSPHLVAWMRHPWTAGAGADGPAPGGTARGRPLAPGLAVGA
ncbi:hypothetical protein J2S46_007214 [Kitasatospora herbaricolor]|uniref:hypothetical protein n=1 Tax=Kitasatospora herbaricolor TaxID=68217 RepID=UPI00174DD68B|nr:hypothetical protein [Kitasatospora herbaricolor]MDQ0312658.1 hypothetical protein [Kitasatospora herbaricolor]